MKEKYIIMRNNKVVDLNFFYEYAVSKGFTLSFHDFCVGAQYLDSNAIHAQLDKEFNLTTLFDEHGNFIKVIT